MNSPFFTEVTTAFYEVMGPKALLKVIKPYVTLGYPIMPNNVEDRHYKAALQDMANEDYFLDALARTGRIGLAKALIREIN